MKRCQDICPKLYVPANARSLTLTPSVGTGEQNTACLNLSLNLLIFESVVLVVSCCLAVAEFGLTTVRLVAAFSFRFFVAVEIRIVETQFGPSSRIITVNSSNGVERRSR